MKTEEAKRVLIVEDEIHIAEGLKLNLALQGYAAQIATSGTDAIDMWKRWRPDLIVLDLMLPGIDGLRVLQCIRLQDERIPILILSARVASSDRVKGLSYGADDYLPKPFNLDEFLLRVERLLTRAAWSGSNGADADARIPRLYVFGGNRINFERGLASCKQGEVRLTEQELKLLRLFVANRFKPLSREKLLAVGWGYTGKMTTRTVDNFMVRLRRYFEDNPRKPKYFRSLRSVGYVFEPDEE